MELLEAVIFRQQKQRPHGVGDPEEVIDVGIRHIQWWRVLKPGDDPFPHCTKKAKQVHDGWVIKMGSGLSCDLNLHCGYVHDSAVASTDEGNGAFCSRINA